MKQIKPIINILITLYILGSLISIIYMFNNNSKLQQEIALIKEENDKLSYNNNYLLNENERLGMINSEVWELFLADHNIKEGE